jgi:hypothetical protein
MQPAQQLVGELQEGQSHGGIAPVGRRIVTSPHQFVQE